MRAAGGRDAYRVLRSLVLYQHHVPFKFIDRNLIMLGVSVSGGVVIQLSQTFSAFQRIFRATSDQST